MLHIPYFSDMVLIIWMFAIAFAIYMLQRNAIRSEKLHERRKEKFEQLLEQLRKSKAEKNINSENGKTD